MPGARRRAARPAGERGRGVYYARTRRSGCSESIQRRGWMLTPLHRLDAWLPLQQALWGVPLGLTLHNAEEAFGVSPLVAQLRRLFPWFRWSARQFLGTLVVVTLLVWGLAFLLDGASRIILLVSVQ